VLEKVFDMYNMNMIVKFENSTGIRDIIFEDVDSGEISTLETILKNPNNPYYSTALFIIGISADKLHALLYLNVPMSLLKDKIFKVRYLSDQYLSNYNYFSKLNYLSNNQFIYLIYLKYYRIDKDIKQIYIKVLPNTKFAVLRNNYVTKEYFESILESNNIDKVLFYDFMNTLSKGNNLKKDKLRYISVILRKGKLSAPLLELVKDNPVFWAKNLISLKQINSIDTFKLNCNYREVEKMSILLKLDIEYCLTLYNNFGELWLQYMLKLLEEHNNSIPKCMFIEPLPIEGFIDKKVPTLILTLKEFNLSKLMSILHFSDILSINDCANIDSIIDELTIKYNLSKIGDTPLVTEDKCNLFKGILKENNLCIKLLERQPLDILKKYEKNDYNAITKSLLTENNIREVKVYIKSKNVFKGIIWRRTRAYT